MKDYPEEALREALLNVLVHRDYAYGASAQISIFDDRIEFLSIGGLVKGITLSDIMLGTSVTRNERLANIFYRLTLIGAYGAGVPKILKSYKESIMQPKFEVTDNAFKITLPNQNEQTPYGDLPQMKCESLSFYRRKVHSNEKILKRNSKYHRPWLVGFSRRWLASGYLKLSAGDGIPRMY